MFVQLSFFMFEMIVGKTMQIKMLQWNGESASHNSESGHYCIRPAIVRFVGNNHQFIDTANFPFIGGSAHFHLKYNVNAVAFINGA